MEIILEHSENAEFSGLQDLAFGGANRQKPELQIANIFEKLNSKISDSIKKTYSLWQSEDFNESFLDYELFLKKTIDTVTNNILEINGIALSNFNEHFILKKFKKSYKDNNISLRTNKKVSITIITNLGKLTFNRYVLRPKGDKDLNLLKEKYSKTTVIPLDEWIGIHKYGYKMTPNTMVTIAFWTSNLLSYHSAAKALKKILNVDISHETIRSVTNDVGNYIFKNEMEKANKVIDLYKNCKLKSFNYNKEYVLYIETDGAMVRLRHDENSNEKRDKLNGKRNEDEQNNETHAEWDENKLGLIFSSDNLEPIKQKESKKNTNNSKNNDKDNDKDNNDKLNLKEKIDKNFIDFMQNNEGKREIHYRVLKREYVSYIGSIEIFQKLLFAAAIKNGYGDYKTTVLLSDGATWIRNMKSLYFPDAIHILDFYHLCEHIYDFAKIYYNENASKYVPWAKYAKYSFKNGKKKEIIKEIELMQKELKNIKFNFHQYLCNNINSIDYSRYIESNYFIGSGHIESGNKSVLQERLKRPGMIWSKEVAQNLLALRAKYKSDLWSEEVEKPFLEHCIR
jgi:hypothetical protein